MTTHGRGGVSRAWLGSVADEIVRSINIPTLLVRPRRADASSGDRFTLDHILDSARRIGALRAHSRAGG